jgi:hypothetical protein
MYEFVHKKTQAKKWPTFLSNLRNAGKVMQKEEDGKDSIVASLRFCRGGGGGGGDY